MVDLERSPLEGAEDQGIAVRRPLGVEGAAGEVAEATPLTLTIHEIEVIEAVAAGCERDPLPVGRPARIEIAPGAIGQILDRARLEIVEEQVLVTLVS